MHKQKLGWMPIEMGHFMAENHLKTEWRDDWIPNDCTESISPKNARSPSCSERTCHYNNICLSTLKQSLTPEHGWCLVSSTSAKCIMVIWGTLVASSWTLLKFVKLLSHWCMHSFPPSWTMQIACSTVSDIIGKLPLIQNNTRTVTHSKMFEYVIPPLFWKDCINCIS